MNGEIESGAETDRVIGENGRWAQTLIGAEVDQALAPRSGTDATTGFSALDELRAIHNGWTRENPPRLERVAYVVTGIGC